MEKRYEWDGLRWAAEWNSRESGYKAEDTGKNGDIAEMVIRSWLRRYSSVRSEINSVAAQGRSDVRVTRTVRGITHRYTLEIKTACGELSDIAKSQYVAYCPEVFPGEDLSQIFHVFTREAFREMLESYPGRGKILRLNAKRGTVHIQSFRSSGRPSASRPIRAYLDECCARMPTLAQWEQQISQRGE